MGAGMFDPQPELLQLLLEQQYGRPVADWMPLTSPDLANAWTQHRMDQSQANDAALGQLMGGRYQWDGKPIRGGYLPKGWQGRASTGGIDESNFRDVTWEKPPDAASIVRNPTDERMWTPGGVDMTRADLIEQLVSGMRGAGADRWRERAGGLRGRWTSPGY